MLIRYASEWKTQENMRKLMYEEMLLIRVEYLTLQWPENMLAKCCGGFMQSRPTARRTQGENSTFRGLKKYGNLLPNYIAYLVGRKMLETSFGTRHSVHLLPCPLSCSRLIPCSICLVQVCNVRNERVIGVRVRQHRANREEDCGSTTKTDN